MSRPPKNTDLFGDSSENSANTGAEEDFASLFEKSMGQAGRSLRTGDSFLGEILSIGKEEAFVSTGTPTDGALPISELMDDKKVLLFKVGDKIEVKVVRSREGEILLRKADSRKASVDIDSLEDAFDMEIPVEGKVIEVVKGGARVQLMGSKLAFCPISQLDLRRVESAQEFVGQKYEFMITQFENGGRNIVVSRKKILEGEKAENEGTFLTDRKPGEILKGKITRLENFGAFVALGGGVEGLIPISELAWGRINNPADVVSLGQDVDVALLRTSEENGRLRISLSLKQAGGEGDPWLRIEKDFPPGRIIEGEIERKEPYGLFVRVSPAFTGLLPRAKWRDRLDASQYENRRKGERISVMIDEINLQDHKISLAPPDERDDGAWRAHSAAHGFGTSLGDLFKNVQIKKK